MRRESSCSSSSCGNSTYRTAVKPRSKPWQLYSPAIKYGTWLGSHLKMDVFLEKSFATSGIIRIFHCRAWLEEGIKKLYNPNTFSPYGHLLSGSASPSKVQTHDEFVWPEMDSLNLGLELWILFALQRWYLMVFEHISFFTLALKTFSCRSFGCWDPQTWSNFVIIFGLDHFIPWLSQQWPIPNFLTTAWISCQRKTIAEEKTT